MRLIAVFVIFVLVTGVMMMSIPDDAFAGKGDKRINLTVFGPDGKHSANASCLLMAMNDTGDNTFGNTLTVGNGGNAGVFVPGTSTSAIAMCNNFGDTGTTIVELIKHTTKLHVHLI